MYIRGGGEKQHKKRLDKRVEELNKKVALLKKSGILLSDNEVSSIDGKIIAKVLAAVNLWVEEKEKLKQKKEEFEQKKKLRSKKVMQLRECGVIDNDEIVVSMYRDLLDILLDIMHKRKKDLGQLNNIQVNHSNQLRDKKKDALNAKVTLLKECGILLTIDEVMDYDRNNSYFDYLLEFAKCHKEQKEKLEQQKIKLRQNKEELGKILKELRDFGVLDNDEIAIMISDNDFIKILLLIAKQRKNSFNEQQDDCIEIGNNGGKEENVSSLVSEVEVVSSEEILLSIWGGGKNKFQR
ncbi:hypothetical protein [Candidatus Neoehrlichia procyonis]|uniref:Uncharacterized protein n=1 Tax=Candidatus Neoehrlichia procyonis str. RAC413 TaxID=1359163 RepID=A0A0F3NLV2_9RICK|nr:hypothetical protein [Candidatus Neoehrlichia lotoris]KJV68751.1 hypothetical protein NLO413_0114 [Candidatus Neoehrlichia lotoris str. RAC413]